MIFCSVCELVPATSGERCDSCRTSPVVLIGGDGRERVFDALGIDAVPGTDIFPEDHGPDWRDEAMRSYGFESMGSWER